MCKYCTELKSLYWNKNHDYVREVYVELDGTLSISTPYFKDELYNGINFKINYCPMCGRKLA